MFAELLQDAKVVDTTPVIKRQEGYMGIVESVTWDGADTRGNRVTRTAAPSVSWAVLVVAGQPERSVTEHRE